MSEIVQLVGKDSLSDDQKLTLEIAKIIREDYLQQNAFTSWDFTCPLDKSIGMMRCIVLFYDLAKQAIESKFSLFLCFFLCGVDLSFSFRLCIP